MFPFHRIHYNNIRTNTNLEISENKSLLVILDFWVPKFLFKGKKKKKILNSSDWNTIQEKYEGLRSSNGLKGNAKFLSFKFLMMDKWAPKMLLVK